MPTTRQVPTKPIARQPPAPRPQQPIVQQPVAKREPRPVSQPKPPPNVHIATAAGENVAETLPPDRGALPSARPVLPPKRQWQKSIGEIHVPTTLLKRMMKPAVTSFSSDPATDSTGARMDSPSPDPQAVDTPTTLSGTAAVDADDMASNSVSPSTAASVAAVPAPRRGSVQTSVQMKSAAAARPASPQLAIMTASKQATPIAAKGPGAVRPAMPAGSHAALAKSPGAGMAHAGAYSASSPSTSAQLGASIHSNAAVNAAGLRMLGQTQASKTAGQHEAESPTAVAPLQQPLKVPQPAEQADVSASLPVAEDVVLDDGSVVPKRQPHREVMTIGEGGELRPMTASTDQSFDTASSMTNSRLQSPAQPKRATGEVPVSLPAALEAPQEGPAALSADAETAEEASDDPASRPSTVDEAEPLEQPVAAAQTGVESALPLYHAPPGRLHRNTVRSRPHSPLQPQISSVHGSNPSLPSRAPAGSPRKAQRAQHAMRSGRQSKVPPLNMAVMRALKQQVSGLVPLSGSAGHATSKTAHTVLQQTAAASQRALSNRQAPPAGLSPKREAHTQLTPLSTSALCSRNYPDGSPLATPRDPLAKPNGPTSAAAQTAAAASQPLLGILTAGTPRQTLSLEATVQLIGDVFDSKGVADLAALRQRAPCRPLQEFVQHYLQRRFGTGAGGSWLGAWQQLEAAVNRHSDDARVAAFATSCRLLQPAQEPSSAQV